MPLNAVPNMAVYLLDKDNKVKQIRFYDDDKNVKLDIDMTDHGHPKAHPIVPHAHDWKNGERAKIGRELTEEEKQMIARVEDGE